MTQKTSQKPKFKRKRLFVDNKVQGSLIRQLIVHWSLACFLIFIYLFALQAFSNGFSLGFSDNLRALGRQYGLLGVVLCVISPVFIYDAVKLSNRFVGPMVSFRAALKKLANGEDLNDVTFRQNDFWKELSQDLNKISSELKQRREQQTTASSAESEVDAADASAEEVESAS